MTDMILGTPGEAMLREALEMFGAVASVPDGPLALLKDIDAALDDERADFGSLRRLLVLARVATVAAEHLPEWAGLYRDRVPLLLCRAFNVVAAVEALAMRPAGEAVN